MNFKKKKIQKIIWILLWFLPFFLGTAGYCMAGEYPGDALYAAFSLYAVSVVSEADNVLITASKWLAPFMTASGLLFILQGLWQRLKDMLRGLRKDATAVYTDDNYGNILIRNLKNGILVQEEEVRNVNDHILFFSDDRRNLAFYQQNKDFFRDKKVYIKLTEIDSYLQRENDICFFHINEIIARQYWREHHLLPFFDGERQHVKIAIAGFGLLGENMLNYGLLNNLYHLNQQIEYHIWGDSRLYEHSMDGMKLMNQDKIICHGTDWETDIRLLAEMDRIIITEEVPLNLLQSLLYLCRETEIHYYNPDGSLLENIYKSESLLSFGRYTDILTEKNIKNDDLYRAAKMLNYQYACMYGGISGGNEAEMERQWTLLDGFTKGSNIAAVDYHEIRRMLMADAKYKGKELSLEELGYMEHIRWCRFHYLNHWSYGLPENGRNRDAAKHIHICLVPFDRLTKEDQEKDYEAVKLLLKLMPVQQN